MTEFELIERYFATEVAPAWLHLGIGDDGAVLQADSRRQVVVTDTLVEGVHFFAGTSAHAIGHKALAVNLSDLAAMGAKPTWFTLNLTLPTADEVWLQQFAAGLTALARQHNIVLVGGDTTRGPLSVSITAAGVLENDQLAFQRSAATLGGRVAVAGGLGLAALAVAAREQQQQATAEQAKALDYPQPQLAFSQCLHGVAAAACDVSDGLLADLGHIASASAVTIELDGAALGKLAPESSVAGGRALLAGGDDYALLFVTLPGVAVPDGATEIGVVSGQGNSITVEGGEPWLQQAWAAVRNQKGYRHF